MKIYDLGKIDLDNNGKISQKEKSQYVKKAYKLLNDLENLEEKLKTTNNKKLKKLLEKYLSDINEIKVNWNEREKITINNLRAEIDGLLDNIKIKELIKNKDIKGLKTLAQKRGMLLIMDITDYENIEYNELKKLGSKNLTDIFSIAIKNTQKYYSPIEFYIPFFKDIGLNNKEILQIYKNVNKNYPTDSILTDIETLKGEGFTNEEVKQIVNNIYTNQETKIKELEKLDIMLISVFFQNINIYVKSFGLKKEEVKQIVFKLANKDIRGFVENLDYLFLYFTEKKDKREFINFLLKTTDGKKYLLLEGANTFKRNFSNEETKEFLEKIIGKSWGVAFLQNIKKYKFLGNKYIKQLVKYSFNLDNEPRNDFIENFHPEKLDIGLFSFNIFLGKKLDKLKKLFKSENDYKKFIEKVIEQTSKQTSFALNRIYDHYDEKGFSHKEIEAKIKENLPTFSTEELISSLGNHKLNYATTFNIVLNEIEQRAKELGYKNIFEYINNDKNLNEKSKEYLKGQVIIGLSARGLVNKLNPLISKEPIKSYKIIKNIINYKNTNFSFSNYLGLVSGITKIIENNKYIENQIYEDFFIKNENPKFKKALNIALFLEGKELTKIGIKPLSEKNKEKYKNIIKHFLIPKEFLTQKENTIIYIYGGEGSGGGLERLDKELKIYKDKFGYKLAEKGSGYYILEKNKIKVIFINFGNIDIEFLKELNPTLVAFRGHNYYTKMMILALKKYLTNHPKSIVVDGGCRNASLVNEYRLEGINNQIVSYKNVGKGWSTFNFTTTFISKYLRKKEFYKNKNITLKKWANKELKDDYSLQFMEFPGSLSDIVIKIENGEL